ncbi:MAG: thioredoxin fold domain-containing protein [Chitinispirillaceae bacterium]|nr:thioredoxin fold domain-containing protein [Chitinispirillaceae bacterium]
MSVNGLRKWRARSVLFSCMLIAVTGAITTCSKQKESLPAEELPLITTSNELLAASEKAGNRLVVLDLYAEWCMPCNVLTPILMELSREYKNSALFYRINIDQSQDLARAFGVRGIPYIVFLKQNKAVYALTGVNPKDSYRKVLDLCKGSSSPEDCVGRLNDRM